MQSAGCAREALHGGAKSILRACFTPATTAVPAAPAAYSNDSTHQPSPFQKISCPDVCAAAAICHRCDGDSPAAPWHPAIAHREEHLYVRSMPDHAGCCNTSGADGTAWQTWN